MKKIILIDGNALVHRAFHALPPLQTKTGELTNAVYGFSSILLKILKEQKPDYIVATFDLATPTFRHLEYKEYKATRVKGPQELYDQMARVKEVLRAFNIPIFEKEGFEADDVLGTLVKKLVSKKDLEIIIASGDLDTLQLVAPNVKIFTFKKGFQDNVFYDEEAVKSRYGLLPRQMVDFKGLKGDPSDNIPGVPGVGDKTASELLGQFDSLENLYENLPKVKNEKLRAKLAEFKDQAFFSKGLATIRKTVPLDFKLADCQTHDFNPDNVKKLFNELEFYRLIDRLPQANDKKPDEKKIEAVVAPAKDVYAEIEKLYKEGIFSKKVYEMEKELAPIIDKMSRQGIKMDLGQLKEIARKVSLRIGELEKAIWENAGKNFNINSSQQLSQVLFEELKIETKSLKKTPGRVISTAAPELEKLKGAHPIIEFIQEYRELAKLKNTYLDTLPELVDKKTGRLHTTFDQLGTVTGRLSSKNPNLQNIPVKTDFGKEVRKAFVTEKNQVLLCADYSQLELRIAAVLSNDKTMIQAFVDGKDIHTTTAVQVFNVNEKDVDSAMRRAAKILNFGIIYGMSVSSFAQSAKIEKSKAKQFVEEYFNDFSGLADYIKTTKERATKDGYVETLLGRRRYIPEINSSAWALRGSGERMAVNAPIQGTAADIVKLAMIAVNSIKGARLLLQVHDELIFEVDKDMVKQIAPLIKQAMEGVIQLAVPLTVEISSGKSWGDQTELGI